MRVKPAKLLILHLLWVEGLNCSVWLVCTVVIATNTLELWYFRTVFYFYKIKNNRFQT